MSLKSPWNLGRFLLLQVLAIGLTGLTMILGAAPLRIVRQHYGGLLYWMSGTLFAAGLFVAKLQEFSFGFFSLVLMVGVYNELESRNWSWKAASTAAVSVSSATLYGLIAMWTKVNGIDWAARIEEEFSKISTAGAELPIESVLAQIPSIISVLMIVSMAFCLLWEPRLRMLLGESEDKEAKSYGFAEFRAPDFLIWMLIPSLLFSTVYFEIQMLQNVALNFLNVLTVLYLFQGLAVIHKLFGALKVGPFWRMLFYFLILIQLPSILLISVLGVTDFWADFRKKIETRLANKEGSSE